MRITAEQVKDLSARMSESNVDVVEVIESDRDGRLQFYVLETKVVRRPLKRLGNGKPEA